MPKPAAKLDNPLMRLAHPLRCAAEPSGAFEGFREFFGPKLRANMSKAFAEDCLTSEATADLCQDPENRRLKQMVDACTQMEGGTEVGNAYAALLYLRQAMHPQPYFVIEDSLVEMLEKTDIADDIPVDMLKVPYSRFYLEFGKARTSQLMLPNVMTGNHILEGAYIERGINGVLGEGLFIVLTGSPLGKSGPMDDATHSLFLPTENVGRSIKDALAVAFSMGKELAEEHGLRTTPDHFLAKAFECVMFIAKVLLYIGLPEARKLLRKEKTEWVKATGALQSTAKKAKAARRGQGLMDHILICAPVAEVSSGKPSESGRSVNSHWRRGHYRTQPYGPQYSLRRVIFISPILVHGNAEDASTPAYRVR